MATDRNKANGATELSGSIRENPRHPRFIGDSWRRAFGIVAKHCNELAVRNHAFRKNTLRRSQASKPAAA